MIFKEEKPYSVSEINEYVRKLLAGDLLLRDMEIIGEVSGYKVVRDNAYFTLKDSRARVQCVMLRQYLMYLKFAPQEGMRVIVRGSASVYPQSGSYQIYVSGMRVAGVGNLYLRFEELKKMLAAEGLFDPAIKRELPVMPKCIGIVTSASGAALHDMIRVSRARNPHIGIILSPCSVQGENAAPEIVRALERLNEDGRADVILCGRGGGSIEDLWAFNEEIVARAIRASQIPVISCVGHETDFTIADFVADVRAATPSNAAELAVPVISDCQASLDRIGRHIRSLMEQGHRLRHAQLARVSASPVFTRPVQTIIGEKQIRLEKAWQRICRAGEWQTQSRRSRLERSGQSIERSMDKIRQDRRTELERVWQRVCRAGERQTRGAGLRLEKAWRSVLRSGEIQTRGVHNRLERTWQTICRTGDRQTRGAQLRLDRAWQSTCRAGERRMREERYRLERSWQSVCRSGEKQTGSIRFRLERAWQIALRSGIRLTQLPREKLDRNWQRIEMTEERRIRNTRGRLERSAARLSALNPGAVLERGYVVVTAGKRFLTSVHETRPDERVVLRFHDGTVNAGILDMPYTKEYSNTKE